MYVYIYIYIHMDLNLINMIIMTNAEHKNHHGMPVASSDAVWRRIPGGRLARLFGPGAGHGSEEGALGSVAGLAAHRGDDDFFQNVLLEIMLRFSCVLLKKIMMANHSLYIIYIYIYIYVIYLYICLWPFQ